MAGEDAVQGTDFTGQYSRFSYDDSKDFVMLLKEESSISRPVPLLDDELNFMQYAQIAQRRKLASAFIGDGSPDNGFLVVGTGATNDFAIKAGKILVDGWLINLAADTTYSGQPIAQSSLTTPGGDRTDNAYIDIWADEIDAAEDASIVDPTITYQTSTRLKLKWAVKVAEGGSVPASGLDGDDKFHWYYKLSTLSRLASNATITAPMVTDARAYNKPLQIADPAIGRKNVLINGAFDIWQRNTTFASSASPAKYTADRWLYYRINYALGGTLSRVTGTSGNTTYGLKMQRNAANAATDASRVAEILEAADVKKFAGRTMTISFWAKAGANYSVANSLFSAKIITGTVADEGSVLLTGAGWTGAATLSADFNITTSMVRYSASFSIPANALELAVILTTGDYVGTAGADDSVTIESVQFEEGAVATQPEYLPGAQELILCQRYYEVGGAGAAAVGSNSTAAAYIGWRFQVSKRTAPQISHNGNLITLINSGTYNPSSNAISAITSRLTGCRVLSSNYTGLSVGNGYIVDSDCLTAEAEL